jgi:hypothetical protein
MDILRLRATIEAQLQAGRKIAAPLRQLDTNEYAERPAGMSIQGNRNWGVTEGGEMG